MKRKKDIEDVEFDSFWDGMVTMVVILLILGLIIGWTLPSKPNVVKPEFNAWCSHHEGYLTNRDGSGFRCYLPDGQVVYE